jgi:hypothetical protein
MEEECLPTQLLEWHAEDKDTGEDLERHGNRIPRWQWQR